MRSVKDVETLRWSSIIPIIGEFFEESSGS
jgi:hypothetical protein